jgi:hypothetical protein
VVKSGTMAEIKVIQMLEFCLKSCKPGHDSKTRFLLKKKNSQPNHASANSSSTDWPDFDSQDGVFTEAES